MRFHLSVPLFLSCLALVSASSAPAAAAGLARVIGELREMELGEAAESGILPGGVARQLAELKMGLRAVIERNVEAPGGIGKGTDELERAILQDLEGQGVLVGPAPGFSGFGAVEEIRLERPDGAGKWLLARATITIPCGSDTSLEVFRRERSRWVPALVFENDGYGDISGALGNPQVRFSPSSRRGGPFLVITDIPPWCTSCWSTVRYRVLRPGPAPDRPLLLKEGSTPGIYRCGLAPYAVAAGKRGFLIGSVGTEELAPGEHALQLSRFSVSKEGATLLSESACDVSGFLGGWILLPWVEAARRVEPNAVSSVRPWHEQLRKSFTPSLPQFVSLEPQGSGDPPEALRFTVKYPYPPPPFPPWLYFTMRSAGGELLVERISDGPPAGPEGGAGSVIHDARSVDSPPELLPDSRVEPRYPPGAREAGIEGRVTLGIVVGSDGSVGSVWVAHSTVSEYGLDVAAAQAVRQWKYRPAMKDGKAVDCELEVVLEFRRE